MREFDDKQADNAQKNLANETTAMPQGEVSADQRAQNVASGHQQRNAEQNMAIGNEIAHGREIGGDVHHFRCCRGVQKVKTEEADEQKDQVPVFLRYSVLCR